MKSIMEALLNIHHPWGQMGDLNTQMQVEPVGSPPGNPKLLSSSTSMAGRSISVHSVARETIFQAWTDM